MASTIEKITPICKKLQLCAHYHHKAIACMQTIGTIGAIVKSTKQIGTQYALDIKDGNEEDDQEMVSSTQNNLNIQIGHLPIKLMCDSIAPLPLSIIFPMVH